MNTGRATVERVAGWLLDDADVIHQDVKCQETCEYCEAGRMLRALLDERDEARALAKQWRDVYEWDAIGHPLPAFYFPWEKKP